MTDSSPTTSGFTVVIPARYASTRLPGKPLRDLAGAPMIVRVCENAVQTGAHDVIVATDDHRILEAVEAAGYVAVMTAEAHPSGTDRIAEVVAKQGLPDDRIVVNVQGDEPLLDARYVRLVAESLAVRPAAGLSTLATPVASRADLLNPNVVKVVTAADGMALYFSRAPIPWVRGASSFDAAGDLPPGGTFLRHIGLYGYRAGTLRRLAALPPAPLEQAESLEQLRALSAGIGIHVSVVDEAPAHGVDTEEDLQRVVAILEERRSS